MRLHFALVGLLLAACTEPTFSRGKPTSPQTEAGSGGSAGKEAGGSSRPPRKPGGRDEVERDAGAAPERPGDEMTEDAGQEASAGESGSAGSSGAGGGTASGATGGSDGAAMPATGDVVGAWSGALEDAIGRDYMACVSVTQAGTRGVAGDSFYTGALNCVGRLSYLETADGVYSFEEATVSGGAACPSGLLTLALTAADTVAYNWYLNQGAIPEATGTLKRTAACP